MKKTIIILLFILVLEVVGFAKPEQKLEISGVWKMFSSEVAGKEVAVSMAITFTREGKIILGNKERGTWKLNKTKNILSIESELLMDLEGECSIIYKNSELHLINSEKQTSKFRRLSIAKEREYNNMVVGHWQLKEIDGKAYTGRTVIVDYNKNGVFYQSGIILGIWNYNKNKKQIMQRAERKDVKELDGVAVIILLDKEKMIYEINGVRNTFQKSIN